MWDSSTGTQEGNTGELQLQNKTGNQQGIMTQTPPEASREKIENMFFFQWNILSSSDITDA